MVRWRRGVAIVLALAACSDGGTSAPTTAQTIASTTAPVRSIPATATTTTTTPTTTAAAPTSTTAAPTTTAQPASTVPPTTLPGVAGLARDALQVAEIGRSLDGRPIRAVERGTRGGTPVLVIGVIHGDEQAGVAILERLATQPVPPGVDLWLVESMNPDGEAVPQRGNADGVDLNRNFPDGWGPIGTPGDGQYAGTGPASEPETQAVVALVDLIGPALTIFYHQDLNRLSPSNGFEGQLKERYSALTGLPIERITGGTYTGVAATWIRKQTGNPSFIVELGPTLTAEQAAAHAAAVADIAAMAAAAG
jgi:protein MpaA